MRGESRASGSSSPWGSGSSSLWITMGLEKLDLTWSGESIEGFKEEMSQELSVPRSL